MAVPTTAEKLVDGRYCEILGADAAGGEVL
jgi:hypothetical protein